MEKLILKDLLNRAEEKLRKENYKEETIQDYKYVWNKFYNMCELFNITYFDLDLAMKFLAKYYNIDLKNGKGRTYTRRMRSIYVLFFNSFNSHKIYSSCFKLNIIISFLRPFPFLDFICASINFS